MIGVDFIASIGIRHLVMAAKTVARGPGKLVLLDPNPLVTEVLFTSGLEDLLLIVRSEDEARAALATQLPNRPPASTPSRRAAAGCGCSAPMPRTYPIAT